MLARGQRPPGQPREDGTDRRGDWPDDLCEIIYVDHFGNAMTGLRADTLPRNTRLAMASRVLERQRTFSDAAGRRLLVREFERARRDSGQPGALRVPISRPPPIGWCGEAIGRREGKPDDAVLFDLLAEWAPDPATRSAILVQNPAKLYGFRATA